MTTYYISPDGSDSNTGTESSPWFSISHASGNVAAGDTIVVQDGTYQYGSAVQQLQNSGSSSAPITLRAADGATPTLVWSGNLSGWENTTTEGILAHSVDHWNIEGLELTQSHSWGLHIRNSSGITVSSCTAHDNAGPGMGVTHGGDDILFKGCRSHHNGDTSATQGDGDGFIANGGGSYLGLTFTDCAAWANTDDGFDCWDALGVTFRWCRASDNGRSGSSDDGSGQGIKLGGGSASGDNHAEHCFAWKNEYAGITDNIASQAVTVWNCTSYDNPRNYEFSADASGQHDVCNCISYQGNTITNGTDDRTNTWNLDISDPQFRSLDPDDEANFLRLADDSPCIDAGTDVGLDYSGSAPDLGAKRLEWSDSEQTADGPALFYHDGTAWQEVSMRYHDGEQFV